MRMDFLQTGKKAQIIFYRINFEIIYLNILSCRNSCKFFSLAPGLADLIELTKSESSPNKTVNTDKKSLTRASKRTKKIKIEMSDLSDNDENDLQPNNVVDSSAPQRTTISRSSKQVASNKIKSKISEVIHENM